MALADRVFLSLFILLMVLHSRAANYVLQKSQEADDSLADSLAAWKKDGLEFLGEPEAHVKADGLQKSLVTKHMHNPTVLTKSGEKKANAKAGGSPQADPKHSETTKQAPNAHERMETIYCRGAGCVIGVVIVLVAVLAGILMCSLAICWWRQRKRHLSEDRQECTHLITHSDSQTSSPEPALPLQQT